MKIIDMDSRDTVADARWRRNMSRRICGVCGGMGHLPGCPEDVTPDPEQQELDRLVSEFGQAIDEVLP